MLSGRPVSFIPLSEGAWARAQANHRIFHPVSSTASFSSPASSQRLPDLPSSPVPPAQSRPTRSQIPSIGFMTFRHFAEPNDEIYAERFGEGPVDLLESAGSSLGQLKAMVREV